MRRYVHPYRVKPSVARTPAAADAMLGVWYSLTWVAISVRRDGNAALARDYARDARNLITVCGARWDKKPMRRRIEVTP